MKDALLKFYDWLIKTIFVIGLLSIGAFIKLQITGSITINPDIFRSSNEVHEIESRLKDLETYEINNLPEKIKGK